MNKYLLYFFGLTLILISSCDDGILIGEDLVDDEEIGTAAREDFTLSAATKIGDPINTFEAGDIKQTFMTGEINDPIFGKYSSDIYMAFRYPTTPNFFEATPDSIVLILEYDTLGIYGDTLISHDLEVYRVEESFVFNDSLESSESFMISATPIGTRTFAPRPNDSITIVNNLGEDQRLSSQLRIRLDDSFAAELFADSMATLGDTMLLESLKGLYVTARSNGEAMLGFNLGSNTTSSLNLYYTRDTTRTTFSYIVRNEVFAHIEHDYTNAPVSDFIDNEEKGDSLIFTQSFQGLDPVISLPELTELKGSIINKATLTLTVAELDEDFGLAFYPVDRQLLGQKYNEDGEKEYIDDLVKFGSSDGDVFATGTQVFGGQSILYNVNGEDVIQYKLNITDYIDNIIKNDVSDPKLILSPLFREESPRNAIFYGAKNSKHPINLRITYTEL